MLFLLLKNIEHCSIPDTYEVIVVDDASEKDYSAEIRKKFPKVTFIRNSKRLFLINSRNIGWKHAKGEYIFFIDDDNEITDKQLFKKALAFFQVHDDIGILGCRTYYFDDPKRILIGVNAFNKLTGKTTFRGMNTIDTGQFDGVIDTHDNPNAFLTKRKFLEEVGGFSPEIVQTFSEADYAERIRKIGLRVVQDSELKVYHKSPVVNFKKMSARHMGGSPERFYYLMRNRFLFVHKFGTIIEKVFFPLVFAHLYTLYYLVTLLRLHEYAMVLSGLRGIRDGYILTLTGRIPNYYKNRL
jgi:GT2 family glycosyltransferase